jgi:putative ABC transport system substrate-binding protein
MFDVRRRDFVALLGGAATAWPLAAGGQQPAMPVIGFLSSRSPAESAHLVAAFREGLKNSGFVQDQNVRIDYRWAEGHYDQLERLASDLVHRQVAAIAAVGNTPSAHAAKGATSNIPIVFVVGDDPVKVGLVDSLSHPRGNLTGLTVLFGPLTSKRFELVHELVPGVGPIAILTNPSNPLAERAISEAREAARTLRRELISQTASTENELNKTFASLVQGQAVALLVDQDPFFTTRREQLVGLAARNGLPAIYPQRDFVMIGGLMSYGGDLNMAYRDAGSYIGRILKGARPADLPVVQSTKVELAINLKAARALGITFPLPLLGRADEVIE